MVVIVHEYPCEDFHVENVRHGLDDVLALAFEPFHIIVTEIEGLLRRAGHDVIVGHCSIELDAGSSTHGDPHARKSVPVDGVAGNLIKSRLLGGCFGSIEARRGGNRGRGEKRAIALFSSPGGVWDILQVAMSP